MSILKKGISHFILRTPYGRYSIVWAQGIAHESCPGVQPCAITDGKISTAITPYENIYLGQASRPW